jgi:hypothetical protein
MEMAYLFGTEKKREEEEGCKGSGRGEESEGMAVNGWLPEPDMEMAYLLGGEEGREEEEG